MIKNKYYIIHKPFGMLCQFTGEKGQQTLGKLFQFPTDVYPVGRLDSDSEGLLILTNDKVLNHHLLDPTYKHQRTYLVQLDGAITPEAMEQLCAGVDIAVDGKNYHTLSAKGKILTEAPAIADRFPPIRVRKNIPTSWIELTLHEGKNRQIRRMTAKVGFPTLRLVRIRIEDLSLETMKAREVKEMNQIDIYSKLKIKI